MRTANPALNDRVFFENRVNVSSSDVMTLEGTVNKTVLGVVITAVAAYWSFTNPAIGRFHIAYVIGSLILGLVLAFKHNLAPLITPIYAVLQGLLLGSISLYAETYFPGIVFQAVSLTFGTLFCLLVVYKSGWIRPSENFKLGLAAATGAIFLLYLVSFVLSFFGVSMSFLHSSSPLSIGISLVVVVIAALNLVLDFDFIESASARGNTPKYMEWYGAFGLLVTLIWLYLEILRLLMKLSAKRE